MHYIVIYRRFFYGKSQCYLLDFVGKLLRGLSFLPGDRWKPAVVGMRKKQNRDIILITAARKEIYKLEKFKSLFCNRPKKNLKAIDTFQPRVNYSVFILNNNIW